MYIKKLNLIDKTYICQEKEMEAKLKDPEIIDQAYDSILDRQFDMKNLMQVIQDVEIIKKVIFHERH